MRLGGNKGPRSAPQQMKARPARAFAISADGGRIFKRC